VSGLMPKEHGAYAQLGFPLVTGLAYGRGAPGAVAFAIAAIAFFLAHEPLALLAGTRGVRLQKQLRAPARRRVLFLAGAAAAGLVAAVGLAPPRAWMAAVLPGGLAVLLLPLLGTRKIKSVPAEILVAAVFAGSLLPLALCGPTSWATAAVAAAVWFAAMVPAILAVHGIKVKQKGKAEGRWTVTGAPASAGLVAATALLAAGLGGPTLRDALAVLPPALAALAVGLTLPPARFLKRVGWTLVAADTLALALLLIL
jgi:hypothetical protein